LAGKFTCPGQLNGPFLKPCAICGCGFSKACSSKMNKITKKEKQLKKSTHTGKVENLQSM